MRCVAVAKRSAHVADHEVAAAACHGWVHHRSGGDGHVLGFWESWLREMACRQQRSLHYACVVWTQPLAVAMATAVGGHRCCCCCRGND